MNAFLHPAHRHTIFGVLLAGIAIASTLLPLSGAESKGKKTSTKASAEATPKPKKSSENSAASSTPKKSSTPAEKKSSSTAKRSTTPKASPKNSKSAGGTGGAEKKSATAVASPSPSKKEQQGDAEESNDEPATSKSGDSTQQRGDSKPSAAKNQKNSKDPAAGSKAEIPGQPAPPLPAKEGSSDPDGGPATGGETPAAPAPQPEAAAPSASTTPAPSTPAPDATSKESDDESATNKKGKVSVAPNVSLAPEDLLGFELQPARVQQLIKNALDLARQKLTYTYGSADPANGGMDCSGAVQYLLNSQGFKDVPRDASGQYVWARKHGQFFAVVSKKADSFEFGDLLPGDLLFWNGTYNAQRDPPVTHTMIYLGVQRKRAQHVMWGSSDGRTYDSKPRWGVSVFDFKMPRSDRNTLQPAKADFLGYARIPGLRE